VFAVVTEQVARVLRAPLVRIVSFDIHGAAEERARHPCGELAVSETTSTIQAPIAVAGRDWGAIIVSLGEPGPLPAATEARLMDFSDLVATAISNANARAEVERLAQQQAALRRVATLVAEAARPAEVFVKVCEEVVVLVPGVEAALIQRYDAGETATVVGSWAAPENSVWVEQARTGPFRLGVRSTLEGSSITASVYRTQQAARIDDYRRAAGSIAASAPQLRVRSSVGSPIFAEGRLWGAIVAATSKPEPLADDVELRLAEFTELLGTAISNLHARAHVQRLLREQAALRRVATLVAQGAPPELVFTKVCEEAGPLLGAEAGLIDRFEADGYCTTVASWGKLEEAFAFGSRWKVEGSGGASELVYRTGRPARQRYDGPGSIAAEARRVGLRSAVGSPIVVGGRVWASLVVATSSEEGFPADAASRLAQFADLVGTSVANVQTRSDLEESRARIVVAADEERRQVVRDLHDGAQQHLAHTIVTVRLARRAFAQDEIEATALVGEALRHAEMANHSLRELAHGILPSILARGGLSAGVEVLAARMPIPVEIDMQVDRLPEAVEATAYFFVAEALANVAKHAQADEAAVTAHLDGHSLHLEVRDDGMGGARADGPGLLVLRDRLAALNGSLRVGTAAGGGTLLSASIPTDDRWSPAR
jgi:signal transduction histidine kinase